MFVLLYPLFFYFFLFLNYSPVRFSTKATDATEDANVSREESIANRRSAVAEKSAERTQMAEQPASHQVLALFFSCHVSKILY